MKTSSETWKTVNTLILFLWVNCVLTNDNKVQDTGGNFKTSTVLLTIAACCLVFWNLISFFWLHNNAINISVVYNFPSFTVTCFRELEILQDLFTFLSLVNIVQESCNYCQSTSYYLLYLYYITNSALLPREPALI